MVKRILLTCGEPAGIGPEIAAKIVDCDVDFVWIGDPRHLPQGISWSEVLSPDDPVPAGDLPVLRHAFPHPTTPGKPDPRNAQAVIDVIARAVTLIETGKAQAMTTLPIHKHVLKQGADFAFPGHTEYLAHLAGGADVVMMLASTTVLPACRVVPATIHIALQDVPTVLTPELLEQTIRITHAAMTRDFGIKLPRLAVAGLNPHAGEGGNMGMQELDWMASLVSRLNDEGLNLTGPHPADTMFHAPARERYDAAICAYHDQALIPIKTLDFAGGVNVTLGLPFVRTSPDHGTAFDIAGTGRADTSSTLAALRMARDLTAERS